MKLTPFGFKVFGCFTLFVTALYWCAYRNHAANLRDLSTSQEPPVPLAGAPRFGGRS